MVRVDETAFPRSPPSPVHSFPAFLGGFAFLPWTVYAAQEPFSDVVPRADKRQVRSNVLGMFVRHSLEFDEDPHALANSRRIQERSVEQQKFHEEKVRHAGSARTLDHGKPDARYGRDLIPSRH
jgi:hypothetical protein